MAFLSQTSTRRRVDSLDALNDIHLHESSLAVWERPQLADIGTELAPIEADAFPDVRTRIHAGKARSELVALIASQGHDAVSAYPRWLADMAALSERFLALAGGRKVTARVETMAGTGCPRFHVDHSHLRLVCTYRGEGTEWLDDAQVNRAAQAGGAANDAIVRFGKPSRLATFAVGLMKGSAYPGCADAGLVHRSPAVEPGDAARVLFCLDC